MAAYQTITLTEDGAVAQIMLNRPAARNAMSIEMISELMDVARVLKARTDIQCVVLAGGNNIFSAGADLKDPARASGDTHSLLERRQQLLVGPDMCNAWEALEQVTIAAIEGPCIGGGVALAAACDFRLAGEGAFFRLPEVALGMNMSWHSLPRLAALMGPARAKRFTIFAEPLPAAAARDWGLADEVTPAGGALALANQWAVKIAALPPLPVRMTKEAVNRAALATAQAATFMDRDQFLLTSESEDMAEGVRAFLEKRDPDFKGN